MLVFAGRETGGRWRRAADDAVAVLLSRVVELANGYDEAMASVPFAGSVRSVRCRVIRHGADGGGGGGDVTRTAPIADDFDVFVLIAVLVLFVDRVLVLVSTALTMTTEFVRQVLYSVIGPASAGDYFDRLI